MLGASCGQIRAISRSIRSVVESMSPPLAEAGTADQFADPVRARIVADAAEIALGACGVE